MRAKFVTIHAKCSDLCNSTITSEDGTVICEHDGYVPSFFPEEHYGDYIILKINIDTGQIVNWNFPDEDKVNAWIITTEMRNNKKGKQK